MIIVYSSYVGNTLKKPILKHIIRQLRYEKELQNRVLILFIDII